MRGCAGPAYTTVIQIQRRKPLRLLAEYTSPTQQHELHLTDQESLCPEICTVDHEVGIGVLSDACNVFINERVEGRSSSV